MNNQEQIDLNNLSLQQVEQLLLNIQSSIGELEIQKQMHLNNYQIVLQRYVVLKKQQETPMAKLPNLKKITLPKANNEQASYTLNK